MSEIIKSYKGFDKNLKCRGFQYEIGREYEEESAEVCKKGFHACERPIDVFKYYSPSESRYCEVEQSGEVSRDESDGKIASTKIKIGAEIGISELVEAQIKWVRSRCTNELNAKNDETAKAGDRGIAKAGSYGAAKAGYHGAAIAGGGGIAKAGVNGIAKAGSYGIAKAGSYGIAKAGSYGIAKAGDRGIATAGDGGVAKAGYHGAAIAGDGGVATSRGEVTVGRDGVGAARAKIPKIRGRMGAVLVCVKEEEDSNEIETWACGIVDCVSIEENAWYTVLDGKFMKLEGKANDDC